MTSRAEAIYKNIALVLASLVFSLVLIELALRLLGWSFPVFAQPDSNLGWSFRPRLQGWATHENTAYVRINRLGFRGADWPQDARGFRIAVLGDSFAESSNLPEEHALTSVIQQNLRACPAFAGGVEVLNLGVSGYGTGQEYVLLTTRLEPLHPDMVLLAFYAGNDVANNVRALSEPGQTEKPYFSVSPEGSLVPDASFRASASFQNIVARDWGKRLINASYLLQAFKQLAAGKPIRPEPKPLDPVHLGDVPQPPPLFAPEYIELFAPPRDATWTGAWAVTEKVLTSMREWAQVRRVQFGIIIIPAPIQVLPTPELRRAAVAKFGLEDLEYPVERIARAAQSTQTPFLDLRGALRKEGDAKQIFLYGFSPRYGDGHLNAVGNSVSGDAIAGWVCEQRAAHPQ
jgi:lysophospholipase L1-like esterase